MNKFKSSQVLSLVEGIDDASGEIMALQEKMRRDKAELVDALVLDNAVDCFTVNMAKVRRRYQR